MTRIIPLFKDEPGCRRVPFGNFRSPPRRIQRHEFAWAIAALIVLTAWIAMAVYLEMH